jgi:hypothetical protein
MFEILSSEFSNNSGIASEFNVECYISVSNLLRAAATTFCGPLIYSKSRPNFSMVHCHLCICGDLDTVIELIRFLWSVYIFNLWLRSIVKISFRVLTIESISLSPTV